MRQTYPWVLSPRVGETFPVVLWQLVFVGSALFGAALRRYKSRLRAAL